MKRLLLLFSFALCVVFASAQVKVPSVKWEAGYEFNRCNKFKVDFYAKGNKLKRTMDYQTYYQSEGKNFCVMLVDDGRKNSVQTVFDLQNEVAIQTFASNGVPYVNNTGKFKYPEQDELKLLTIVPAEETKKIAGYDCKRYTYTYKKIFGEVWITDQINLSNDYGIFRAAKMSLLHNTLSVGGFVMEMTSEDAKGGKTIMTTLSIQNVESFQVDYSQVDMSTAINKVNYFTF